MKLRLNTLIFLAVIACTQLIAQADVLMLKDGQTVSGRFMGADQGTVSFSTNGLIRRFSISEINSITFTAPMESAPPPPPSSRNAPPPYDNGRQQPAPPPPAQEPERTVYNPPPMSPPPSADRASAPRLGYTVHAGSILTVRMIDPVNSATDSMGQTYRATLDEPIMVDGQVAVPRGADVTVKLASKQEAGRMTGRSELNMVLYDITVQGQRYEISTSEVTQSGASRGKQTATRVGVGTVLGAAIGAIAGGGKGAAIGAATGAGAGGAVQVMTKGDQVKVPSETRLDFTLSQPLNL